MDWDRYENELDDGISTNEPYIDPVATIIWCAALVGGLAFWTAVGIIGWKLVT
jgi:hypothetical protein